MAEIVTSCADELSIDKFPCAPTLYGFPNKLVIMHAQGDPNIAGETPTLAEIVAGQAAAGLDKMVLIEQFTNGQRTIAEQTAFSGADTADGLEDVDAVYMLVSGKIKMINERLSADLLTLSRQQNRVRFWIIFSEGYIFGGQTGYYASNFFPPIISEGFGVQNYIPLNVKYQVNRNQTDPSRFDLGFKDLVNTDIS